MYMFQQGKKFKNNQNKYNNLVKSSNLEQISLGELNIVNNLRYNNYNVIEGFDNEVEKINTKELQKLQSLEQDFNKLMNQYLVKYKKYLEELQTRQSSGKSQYRNKVIKDINGDKYYVNNIGMARQFSDAAWVNKDKSCPDPHTTISAKDFSQISLGSNMGIGEKCATGGYNAVDASSGTTAWIDTLGYKHLYDDFRNRHKTCPSQTQKLTSIQFNAIPNGSSFDRNDICSVISLDSPLYDQIMALNNQLLRKVEEMKTEIDILKKSDADLDKNIEIQKQKLTNVYNELKKQKQKINRLKTKNKTMIAETDELILNSSAIQFHHLIWMVVGASFLTFAITYSK
jgi:hypothetical protein